MCKRGNVDMKRKLNKNYEKLKRKAQEKTQQILQGETTQKEEQEFSFTQGEEAKGKQVGVSPVVTPTPDPTPAPAQENTESIKITMLGASGSGKTVFLSGIYQTLVSATAHGFFLSIDEDAKRSEQFRSLEGISLITEDKDEGFKVIGFPSGTAVTKTYDFTLKSKGRSYFPFEFWDYRGNLVSEVTPGSKATTDKAEIESFREHLRKSDVLLIFADATKISQYDVPSVRKMKSQAYLMEKVFNTVLDMVEREYHVILVLTKIDDQDVKIEDKKDNYKLLCEKAMEVFSSIRDGSKTFAMIPVSAVGENKTEKVILEDDDGKIIRTTKLKEDVVPSPININTVMIYACMRVLKNKVQKIQREIKYLWKDAEEIEESYARLRGKDLRKRQDEYDKIVFGEIPNKEAEQKKIEDDIKEIKKVYGTTLRENTYYKKE